MGKLSNVDTSQAFGVPWLTGCPKLHYGEKVDVGLCKCLKYRDVFVSEVLDTTDFLGGKYSLLF